MDGGRTDQREAYVEVFELILAERYGVADAEVVGRLADAAVDLLWTDDEVAEHLGYSKSDAQSWMSRKGVSRLRSGGAVERITRRRRRPLPTAKPSAPVDDEEAWAREWA